MKTVPRNWSKLWSLIIFGLLEIGVGTLVNASLLTKAAKLGSAISRLMYQFPIGITYLDIVPDIVSELFVFVSGRIAMPCVEKGIKRSTAGSFRRYSRRRTITWNSRISDFGHARFEVQTR